MPFLALDPTTAQAAPAITHGNPLVSTGETLLSLRTELSLRLAGRPDVTTDRLNQWVNFAYIDVCSSLELEELESGFSFNTVIGQPFYKVPISVGSTLLAAIVDAVNYPIEGGLPLIKIDRDRYRREPLLADEPKAFFRQSGMIVLYPTPTAVRTVAVDFKIRPVKLTSDDHSPILPYEWHEAVLLLAKAKGHAALLEPDLAAVAENDWVNFTRRKVDTRAAEDTGKLASMSPVRSNRQLRRYGNVRITDNSV